MGFVIVSWETSKPGLVRAVTKLPSIARKRKPDRNLLPSRSALVLDYLRPFHLVLFEHNRADFFFEANAHSLLSFAALASFSRGETMSGLYVHK